MKKKILASAFLAATLAGAAINAQAADAIRIGYQTNVDPAKSEEVSRLFCATRR